MLISSKAIVHINPTKETLLPVSTCPTLLLVFQGLEKKAQTKVTGICYQPISTYILQFF